MARPKAELVLSAEERDELISDAKVEQVVATTLESTPRNATHWSSRSMARKMGIGRSAVQEIWRAFASSLTAPRRAS